MSWATAEGLASGPRCPVTVARPHRNLTGFLAPLRIRTVGAALLPLQLPLCGSYDARMPSGHVVVSSTTDSEDAARALAAGAIEAKLGACAQVVGPIISVFRWEGEVQAEQEWRVEIKTAADRVPALTEHIKANHGYDVPEIIATPITGGSAEYLSWVAEQTRG